jgi:GWxTD domain-containing protein
MRSWIPVLSLLLLAAPARPAALPELAPRHAQFLDDVEWILTSEEHSAFLSLDSDERRDQFIELFWRQRDPTPATLENEFRDEHQRRLRQAEEFLGKGSRMRGSKTERGRIYVLLGKPLSVQREDGGKTWPIELWFYQGLQVRGLPSSMYVVFFKPHESGEWRLYSPVSDGPTALVRREQTRVLDNSVAYRLLSDLDQELGRAALSLDATSRPDTLSFSPTVDTVMAGLARVPGLGTDPGYVQRFLEGKTEVELDYSFVYVPLRATLWTTEQAGRQFLAYALQIEPRDLSVSEYEGRYSARIEIDGTIEDERGKRVADVEDHLEFGLSAEQLKAVAARPIQVQGRRVVPPGTYRLRLVLRNLASRQYGRFEGSICVPEPGSWGPPLLAYRVQVGPDQRASDERPFDLGPLRAFPWTGERVSAGAPVIVLARAPTEASAAKLTLTGPAGARIWRAPVHAGVLRFQLPADSVPAGGYRLDLEPVPAAARSNAGSIEPLRFTAEPAAWAEPWIVSGRLAQASGNEVLLQEAEILEKTGRAEQAIERVRGRFEAGGQKDPALRFALASLCLKARRFAEAQALAEPPAAQLRYRKPARGEDLWFRVLAFAQAGQGRPAEAARTLGEALERTVPAPELLNQQARWFIEAGEPERARQAFLRSIEIDQDQPEVRKELDALR